MIKDSEMDSARLPVSRCVYQNANQYIIVEINTGYSIGSIKCISPAYPSYDDAVRSHQNDFSPYPFLYNHIIYNDSSPSGVTM